MPGGPFAARRPGRRFAGGRRRGFVQRMFGRRGSMGPGTLRCARCGIVDDAERLFARGRCPRCPPRSEEGQTSRRRLRRCGGVYLKAATLIGAKIIERPQMSTTRGQIDLCWCDVEVHHRHPVVASGHDDQANGDQPACVGPRPRAAPTTISIMIEKMPDGDWTKPDT